MEKGRLRTFVDILVSHVAIGILLCPVIVSVPTLINGDEAGVAETAPATSVSGTASAPTFDAQGILRHWTHTSQKCD